MALRICAVALSSFSTVALASVQFSAEIQAFLGRLPSSSPPARAPADATVPDEPDLAKTARGLHPIFATLPLNEYGRLDSAGLRYLMYRHFLHQHGWLMRGLAPDGDPWNSTFPMWLLQHEAPRHSLAQLLAHRGLDLEEAVALAGTLKEQVEEDARKRLRLAWRAHALGPEDFATIHDMDSILDLHMTTYMAPHVWARMQLEFNGLNNSTVDYARKQILEMYPTWPNTQMFLREALQEVRGTVFDFKAAEKIVERILDRFGHFQDRECDELRRKLVLMESPRQGRVDLVDFYREAVNDDSQWMFSESLTYLRELGAVDESEPERPSILIPNYINSAANHIGRSKYFHLACLDECEELFGHFERRLGAPAASPRQIAAVALRLPSSSHPQREFIPDDMLEKLEHIADTHGGQVPLHGRLFAQWLHHMYPRDCPYPHAAGSTRQEQADEFEIRTGLKSNETIESMARTVASLESASRVQTSTALPWDMAEELLDPPRPPAGPGPGLLGRPLQAPLLAATAGLLVGLLALAGRALRRSRFSLAGAAAQGPLLDAQGAAPALRPSATAGEVASVAPIATGNFLSI